MLGQLEEQVSELRAELEAAEAAGEEPRAADVRDALATKQAWLDQIRSSMA